MIRILVDAHNGVENGFLHRENLLICRETVSFVAKPDFFFEILGNSIFVAEIHGSLVFSQPLLLRE